MVSPDPGVADIVTVPLPHLEPLVPVGVPGKLFTVIARVVDRLHPLPVMVTVYDVVETGILVIEAVVSVVFHK
jgi:hypothetical protein